MKEILERNATLFKDDENFVPYLIDLALYLLEYEYDWKDSGAESPRFSSDRPAPAAPPAPPPPSAAKPQGPLIQQRGAMASYSGLRGGASITPGFRGCPHCGGQISTSDSICPHCRNMVR